MTYDIDKIRADFPILSRQVNGKPLVYLDNGASAQKPQVVIDAVTQACKRHLILIIVPTFGVLQDTGTAKAALWQAMR